MPKFTEGDYIDQDGTVKLLAYILNKIKTYQGDKVLSTMPAANCTECLLSSGSESNWTAHGTMLQVPEKIYLTSAMRFRTIFTQVPEECQVIPAIYRYSDTGVCTLVASGAKTTITATGWCDINVTAAVDDYLNPNLTYFLIYLHNAASMRTLGYQSPHVDNLPYVAWTAQNLGALTQAPQTLSLETAVPIKLFGSLYVNQPIS
jgi:hypothetical protein